MRFQVNTLFPPNRRLVKQKIENSPARTQCLYGKLTTAQYSKGTYIHRLGVWKTTLKPLSPALPSTSTLPHVLEVEQNLSNFHWDLKQCTGGSNSHPFRLQAAGFQGLCPSVKSTCLQVLRLEFSSWSTLGLVCMGYSSWKALRSHESCLAEKWKKDKSGIRDKTHHMLHVIR